MMLLSVSLHSESCSSVLGMSLRGTDAAMIGRFRECLKEKFVRQLDGY